MLELNCKSENFENINSAIASNKIKFEVIRENFDNRGYKVRESTSGNQTTLIINEIIQNNEKTTIPFLIKFDIEGFEKDVFINNLEWLKKFKIIIIEIHDWMLPGENSSENFIKAIVNLKKDIILSGENIILINNEYKI